MTYVICKCRIHIHGAEGKLIKTYVVYPQVKEDKGIGIGISQPKQKISMGSLQMTHLETETNPVKMIVRSFLCWCKSKTKAITTANHRDGKDKEQLRTQSKQ